MVLNPLSYNLIRGSRGGFYSYYNLQCIELDKERKNVRKKKFNAYKKHLTQFLKKRFNPVLGSIPRLPKKIYQKKKLK